MFIDRAWKPEVGVGFQPKPEGLLSRGGISRDPSAERIHHRVGCRLAYYSCLAKPAGYRRRTSIDFYPTHLFDVRFPNYWRAEYLTTNAGPV